MSYNVLHPTCGEVMIVYTGNTVPTKGTSVDWTQYRHVSGAPINPSAPATCDSCGGPLDMAPILDPTTYSADWVQVTVPTYTGLATANPTYTG